MALTEKQERFCRNIVSGMTGKDSYIEAYNSKGSADNAYNEASKLMQREDIQERLKVLRKPLEEQAQTHAISEREKKRTLIWEGIQRCIAKEDENGVARYMDILNKMDSEYININRNIEDKGSDIANLDLEALKKLSEDV